MNKPSLIKIFFFVLTGISIVQAEDVTQCLSDLKKEYPKAYESTVDIPLPKNCRRLGPIALNMTYQQVAQALGPPAKQDNDGNNSFTLHYYRTDGFMQIHLSMEKGKLQEIEINAPYYNHAFPFGFYGYQFGIPIDMIMNELGPGVTWNRPKDVFMYGLFPIQFHVTEDRHIDGISISNPGF